MIRVVLVDDHAVVREGLRFLLEQQADMEVVGEGKDGAQGVALVTSLLPDVVLLDLLMPKMDGITAVREMKRLTPRTQTLTRSPAPAAVRWDAPSHVQLWGGTGGPPGGRIT